MPYAITFDRARAFIRVTITGEISVNEVRSMTVEVVRTARSRGLGAVLLDYCDAVIKKASFADVFGLMTNLEELGVRPSDLVALVYAGDADRHQFAETVAVTQALANIRYFTDITAAEEWLAAETRRGRAGTV